LATWIARNRDHQPELQTRLLEAALPCDSTAAVQVATWVYEQTESEWPSVGDGEGAETPWRRLVEVLPSLKGVKRRGDENVGPRGAGESPTDLQYLIRERNDVVCCRLYWILYWILMRMTAFLRYFSLWFAMLLIRANLVVNSVTYRVFQTCGVVFWVTWGARGRGFKSRRPELSEAL
jgi:hypothetical protein